MDQIDSVDRKSSERSTDWSSVGRGDGLEVSAEELRTLLEAKTAPAKSDQVSFSRGWAGVIRNSPIGIVEPLTESA